MPWSWFAIYIHLPSIYPSHVSINLPYSTTGSVMGLDVDFPKKCPLVANDDWQMVILHGPWRYFAAILPVESCFLGVGPLNGWFFFMENPIRIHGWELGVALWRNGTPVIYYPLRMVIMDHGCESGFPMDRLWGLPAAILSRFIGY